MREEISEIWGESNDRNIQPMGATSTHQYMGSHGLIIGRSY